jgi:transposase InsO family protein
LIRSLKQEGYSVSQICKVLKLPESSYYRRASEQIKAKEISDKKVAGIEQEASLLEKIKTIKANHLFWGYRRVRAYLKRKLGISVSYKRVYRLMKKNDLLVERKRYKAKRTPQKDKPKPVKSNQWWGTDMTKFYINSFGWVYLVVVLDWYSKKIVGYKLNVRSKAEDWIDALNMAVDNNCPLGSREYDLHLMSDNGSQPTSEKYENSATLLGIKHITTSYSNPKGNADTERFMRTFKEEIIYPNEFDSFEEAKTEVDNFIAFYNHDYPHSALGYLSPIEFEKLNNYKNVA